MQAAISGVSDSASAVIKEFIAAAVSKSVSIELSMSFMVFTLINRDLCHCTVKGLINVPPMFSVNKSISANAAKGTAIITAIFAAIFAKVVLIVGTNKNRWQ
ncbi:hypothetical protein N473_07040 [Pseudoalteromonas luteoviolacea CPMOR-1]|uniref:Uncharacterized protein n=1 Tax=Pseudoalteromonas luteoviolacea CPMOR-1 TaxID=1365248 RepID=A0A167H4I5_9GAMM|nr:hypothetical protein [Pseudoalteromonas luteoviolacea]KZN57624.1 hypothetical protein N473_07040 [Pseudoalteromonas luteoviolacea CPMOR-1]